MTQTKHSVTAGVPGATVQTPSLWGVSFFAMGGASANGFTTADYVQQATASAVPALGPGQSFVIIFVPKAVPTGAQFFAAHTSNGKGFLIGAGSNAGARSRCSLVLAGLNANADVYFTGSDFASLLDAPMVIACAILADKSVRYSVNGATVVAVSALSGTYSAPASGDTYYVGYPGVGTTSLIVAMNTYSSELTDADLAAAAARLSEGVIPTLASGTVSTRFAASDFAGGVRVVPSTGVTWIAKAEAAVRPIT